MTLGALIGLGVCLALVGIVLWLAGGNLRRDLVNEPFHRDGDALAAYLQGCGLLLGIAGLLVGILVLVF